jgi:hypothetical protein
MFATFYFIKTDKLILINLNFLILTLGYYKDKSAKAIAYVKGGIHNNKIIWLNNENIDSTLQQKMDKEDSNAIYIMDKPEPTKLCLKDLKEKVQKVQGSKFKIFDKDFKLVSELLNLNQELTDVRLKNIYNIAKTLKSDSKNEFDVITIYDGFVQQLPRMNDNKKIIWRQYIATPCEFGKSTYVANLIKEYKDLISKTKEEAKVYLFSNTPKNELFDSLGIIKVALNQELIDNPIESEELTDGCQPTLVIFDDIDSIIDKKLFKQVTALRDQILQKGRHHNISCICTNHKLADYKNTSIILNEAQYITLFPKATAKKNFAYIMKSYCGLDDEDIDITYKLPSRFVTVCKLYPTYILYQSGVYLLNK